MQIQLKHVFLSILALILFLYISAHSYTTSRVDGDSMFPTLNDEEFLLVSKYWFSSPERGDIISTRLDEKHHKDTEGTTVVKRIIGMPGEIIEFKNRRFSVINPVKGYMKFRENYLIDPQITPSWDGPERKFLIPVGHYFVLGDNREISQDSRDYGTMPLENIIGKVVYKIPALFEIKNPEYDFKYKTIESVVFEKIKEEEKKAEELRKFEEEEAKKNDELRVTDDELREEEEIKETGEGTEGQSEN